jgi:hypothetical protein
VKQSERLSCVSFFHTVQYPTQWNIVCKRSVECVRRGGGAHRAFAVKGNLVKRSRRGVHYNTVCSCLTHGLTVHSPPRLSARHMEGWKPNGSCCCPQPFAPQNFGVEIREQLR